MTAALSSEFILTEDQLRAAAAQVGVDGMPTVLLMMAQRHPTVEQREAAIGEAARELVSRRLIAGGGVHPELAAGLHALHRPDRELAARLITPDGVARISVVRRGMLTAVASRAGDDIRLRIVGHTADLGAAVTALRAELPAARPADVVSVGAPLGEFSETLMGTHDALCLADRIRALGAEPQAAILLAKALAVPEAFAEIVYYALAKGEDRIIRGPAAVALFYTKRGRVIGAPSISPSGQLWTTLKVGSEYMLRQAVSQLVELSTRRWASPTNG